MARMFRTTGPHYPNLWLMATCQTVLKCQRSPKPVSSSKTTSSNAPGLEGSVGTCWEASVSQFDKYHSFLFPSWKSLKSADVSWCQQGFVKCGGITAVVSQLDDSFSLGMWPPLLVQAPGGSWWVQASLRFPEGCSCRVPGALKNFKCPVVQPETSEMFEMFEMSRLVAWKPGLAISLLPAPTKTLSSAAASPNTVHSPSRKVMQKNWFILTCLLIFFHVLHHLSYLSYFYIIFIEVSCSLSLELVIMFRYVQPARVAPTALHHYQFWQHLGVTKHGKTASSMVQPWFILHLHHLHLLQPIWFIV